MDPGTRTVDEGRLYSSRGVLLRDGWGFVASVEGCTLLPATGLVRLGGDGRMARLAPWPDAEPDWSAARRAVAATGRFRWVLQTPAIFTNGWRPAAVREDAGALVFERDGFRARLVSAAIAPAELAGGWDLVNRGPKPFRLMAPAGSVYWFEVVSGSGEDAWRMFHGRSVSDEKANEGFGIVHVGGWPNV
jgi:CRISPR-associated protein Cmr3